MFVCCFHTEKISGISEKEYMIRLKLFKVQYLVQSSLLITIILIIHVFAKKIANKFNIFTNMCCENKTSANKTIMQSHSHEN